MKHIDEWWTKRLPSYALEEAEKRIEDAVQKARAEREIVVDETEWEVASNDGSMLHTIIHVNGIMMHLEAHAVKWLACGNDQHLQMQDGESSAFDALNRASESNSAQVTTTINGRIYVLFAYAQGGGLPPEEEK